MTDAELARLIREHAYLEGDFVLRSGRRSRYYLDKYRFETEPRCVGPSESGSSERRRRRPGRRPAGRSWSSAPSLSPPPPRSRRAFPS